MTPGTTPGMTPGMTPGTTPGMTPGTTPGADAATRNFDSMWSDLLPVGRSRSGGYRRFAWTSQDAELREWFAAEADRRGLDLTCDRAGNLWAWWGDADAAAAAGDPGVVVGSHLDSVPDGGAYDGPLGVVSAFAALDALRATGHQPARPIGVACFSDEEGARFGIACAGSRVLTGALEADTARGLSDGDGTTMAEAMSARQHPSTGFGRDDEALRRIGAFVELHVEQGRSLVDRGGAVGVASSIWPHGRWRLDLVGEANHAGTTRLVDRHDPMLALAAAVIAARRSAEQHGCVATIGKVSVEPNGVNAIASRVSVWLDARGPVDADVHAVVAAVEEAAATAAQLESLTAETTFDVDLRTRIVAILDGAPVLPTGAGHDAGVLAAAGIPTAMLFVRNPTGVSHSPKEHAEREDCLRGVDALARVVRSLTG